MCLGWCTEIGGAHNSLVHTHAELKELHAEVVSWLQIELWRQN